MAQLPDTRESLLVRLRDPGDAAAWRELAEIYRPAVYRLARKKGLQDADAEDLAQRVLVVISQKIADWRPVSPRGSFRAWLSVVARNQILNALTRGRAGAGEGGTSVLERLRNHPERDAAAEGLDEEYRRALFRRCSLTVRREFEEATWAAFWLTAVEGIPVEEAARRLGKTAGGIYASRSRVMRRLKQAVREIETAETGS